MDKYSELQSVAATWAQRAQAELGAEARFRTLALELHYADAHPKIIEMALVAKEDERRHAKICSEVARDFGHSTGFQSVFESQPIHKKSWETRSSFAEKLLCEVTLLCCITETINSSLLNSIYGNAENSPTRKVVQNILKDEVKHSQIGWAHLAAESVKRDLSFVGDYFGEMLNLAVRDELFLPAPREEIGSFNYGVMPAGHRMNQFLETMDEVVLPGLEKFGIVTGGAHAWLLEKSDRKTTLAAQ